MVCSILEAKYLGDYRIALVFSDGMSRIIDFGPFLTNARNPMTKKYLDKNLFKSFTLLHGDIMWNDFELCFPIWNLHEGNI
jgi:hypothetical protein